MEIKSLGFKTDIMVIGFTGKVTDCDDYVIVESPENPGYFWGNFILFANSPKSDLLGYYEDVFHKKIGYKKDTRHISMGWDTGDINECKFFLDEGYKVEASIILSTNQTNKPPKFNSEVEVRPLISDQDWEDVVELQCLYNDDFELRKYKKFKQDQFYNYRKMSMAGHGHWYGAFLNNKLVGDLGIFQSQGCGRYQSVETHPEYLRMGICGTLVYKSSILAASEFNIKTLVMVADEEYHAARIYESVGFKPSEKYVGVWKCDSDWMKSNKT